MTFKFTVNGRKNFFALIKAAFAILMLGRVEIDADFTSDQDKEAFKAFYETRNQYQDPK